ncbi:MAG TPA: succinate dehydrogenase, hydrophobic membrane anchor protein [Burkholderiales bacterium]
MRIFGGQRAFVLQRLTALVLLAYAAGAAARLAFGAPVSLEGWRAWAATPAGAALIALLAAALLLHAWVGVRDVVLDYVHPLGLRLALLGAAAAGLLFLGLWTALILVSHAL